MKPRIYKILTIFIFALIVFDIPIEVHSQASRAVERAVEVIAKESRGSRGLFRSCTKVAQKEEVVGSEFINGAERNASKSEAMMQEEEGIGFGDVVDLIPEDVAKDQIQRLLEKRKAKCPLCNGTGISTSNRRCPFCAGAGYVIKR